MTASPPPLPSQRPLLQRSVRWLAIAAGLAYGLAFRLLFKSSPSGPFEVMSVAFLFGMPFGLGFLQVYLSEAAGRRRSWAERLLLPWIPALLCLGCALLLAWEGLICVFLWVPVVLVLSLLGGLVAGLTRDFMGPRGRQFALAWCLMLPIVITPVERAREPERQIRTVHTAIAIEASPAQIWGQIKSVPAIRPEELNVTWTHRVGFPRPVAAALSHEGVGGVRRASFEGDVVFWETVTRWEPERDLAFTIRADTASIPARTLDEHVTIGGRYFDVLTGEYRIESTGPGRAVLHLSSEHRLSTGFDFYASWWTDAIMRDVQENILQVIKKRCEGR